MQKISPIGKIEFISLMALLMSLAALVIDSIMPGLTNIGASLGVQDPNNNQFILSAVFLGMAMGLMIYGPLSDSYGRKNAIYLGVLIFLIGNITSLLSTDLTIMIIGRILQGFGVAACRVVPMAIVRDTFEGREMGKVMSLIIMFFIIVPVIAPSIGQFILLFSSWRAIFGVVTIIAIMSLVWLHIRQPETLAKEKRLQFSVPTILAGIRETLTHPKARAYTIAAGIIFGAFVGYLSSAQQILQIQYGLGELFPIYFGMLALSIGLASFANSQLVMKFRMETLCLVALLVISFTSFVFFFYAQYFAGHPAFIPFMAYLVVTFFCFGILFGNFNTLAIQPLGHIAGVANSIIGSIQMFLSIIIGGIIGQSYDGTIQPLVLGFLLCGVITLFIIRHIRKKTILEELLEGK